MSRLAVTKLLLSGSNGPPLVHGTCGWAMTMALVASEIVATSTIVVAFNRLNVIACWRYFTILVAVVVPSL